MRVFSTPSQIIQLVSHSAHSNVPDDMPKTDSAREYFLLEILSNVNGAH